MWKVRCTQRGKRFAERTLIDLLNNLRRDVVVVIEHGTPIDPMQDELLKGKLRVLEFNMVWPVQ